MLDINFIRQNPEKVKEGCRNKNVDIDIDRLLELDKQKREMLQEIEQLRHQRNLISEKKGLNEKEIERAKELKVSIKNLSEGAEKINKEFDNLISQIPNLTLDDVPKGKDEEDNVVVRKIGDIPKFDFKPKDHLELGENLDIIDVKRAAKVAGPRFGYLKREAVLLEFSLINFAFEFLLKKGFIPVIPPVMIKPEMMWGMGYFIKAPEEGFFIEKDKLYLIGTAEQSLGPMHSNEILDEKELPKRYFGFSTCFRREAGAYGKDTKGIFRVHQFDKIEMFSLCKPEDSIKEHQSFLKIEEELMTALKLPYRVVRICTGDMAFPTASQYDIEAWFPGQNKYRETHSTSNCTDFQARRLNIRYKDSREKKLEFVHTVNGTAFSQRALIAILENYQRKDGKINVPKVLQKYLGFKTIPRK